METFLDRLKNEEKELTERINKLSGFTNSEHFNKVDDVQKALLKVQLAAMRTYQECLNERITRL